VVALTERRERFGAEVPEKIWVYLSPRTLEDYKSYVDSVLGGFERILPEIRYSKYGPYEQYLISTCRINAPKHTQKALVLTLRPFIPDFLLTFTFFILHKHIQYH
jgi:hypothetical protein